MRIAIVHATKGPHPALCPVSKTDWFCETPLMAGEGPGQKERQMTPLFLSQSFFSSGAALVGYDS